VKKLIDNLTGNDTGHIFPLFWMHGESEEILREYMEKIQECGITSVCLEARPHPEFVGTGWWRDVDIILDEAKKRGMKIWILDDSHFPTGYANGAVKKRYPQHRKRFLKLHQLDFAGPMKHAQALIRYAFTDEEDQLEGIYLVRKKDYEAIDLSEVIDLSGSVSGKETVSFDLPEGEWKLLVLVSSFSGGEKETEDYLNPIVPEAVDVLIEEVYEPHYNRYKEEFGKTILGFFSDEPRFGNVHGPYGSIGRADMVLPWRDDIPELLAEKIRQLQEGNPVSAEDMQKENSVSAEDMQKRYSASAEDIRRQLPLLFIEAAGEGEASHRANQFRYHYMDLVSSLYAENFSERIGNWCRSHGVKYIGHTIEDNNAHARLGYGDGHFFRAMRGQDMAGIDVVLHQLMPGMDHGYNKAMTKKGWDGEFFHYVLGKLGASLGHLDPTKHGKVMCEVYGAYGWSEGNRLMKWITDYMLVRGVNEFVPHAFDPKEYPDTDCPPHFYAHGKNPQYPDFRKLMEYTNRLSHLLSGGVHRAPVAVSYHGEAEWSGDYMLTQKPCAELCRNQIDYDIVPAEMVISGHVEEGKLCVNEERFEALVIPYAEALPAAYLRKLAQAAGDGLKLFVLHALPERSSEGIDAADSLRLLSESPNVSVVETENLIEAVRARGIGEIRCADYEPYLRYYHYEQPDGQILMFVNEGTGQTIHTEVEVPMSGRCFRYDAFENVLCEQECREADAAEDEETGSSKEIPELVKCLESGKHGKSILSLQLEPCESAVFCWLPEKEECQGLEEWVRPAEHWEAVGTEVITAPISLRFAKQEEYPKFSDEIVLKKLIPVQEIPGKEFFTGVIRYDTTFHMEETADKVEVVLDKVYEGARVSVNGSAQKVRICPPYRFDVTDAVKTGENSLQIEVTTTLGRERKDWLSQFILLEPTGITEQIRIERFRKAVTV